MNIAAIIEKHFASEVKEPCYEAVPFSSIVGCGILNIKEHFIVATIPPSLPENLYGIITMRKQIGAKIDSATVKHEYYHEIKTETERIAKIVCDALNNS